MNQLVAVVEREGLVKTKSEMILKTFEGFFKEVHRWEEEAIGIVVSSEDDKDQMQRAREVRLELKKIRVETEKRRKELKEGINREGKAIDGIANIIKAAIVPIEEHLTKQEKFIELLEKERLDKIELHRQKKLSEYLDPETVEMYPVRMMDDKAFDTLLESVKIAYQQRIEAEEKARKEQERLEKIRALHAERSSQIIKEGIADYIGEAAGTMDFGEIEEASWEKAVKNAISLKKKAEKEQEKIRKENERLRLAREAAEKKERVRKSRIEELKPYVMFIRDYEKLLSSPETEYQKELKEVKTAAELHWENEIKKKAEEERQKREAEEKERAEKEKLAEQKAAEERAKKEAEEKARQEKLRPEKDKVIEYLNNIENLCPPDGIADTAEVLKRFKKDLIDLIARAKKEVNNL